MTPKDKALQLFKSYLNVGMGDGWAKQCALIAVDEIIESRKDDSMFGDTLLSTSSEYYNPHPMYITYWLQVKQEIEKL
jgi:hypothetical protein